MAENSVVKRPDLDRVIHYTRKPLNWVGILLGFWLLPTVAPTPNASAAERVYLSYDILERSISVDSLAAYAQQGRIKDDLAPYIQYAKPEQQAQLRNLLLRRLDVSPVPISQFLYTPPAEILLQRLGEVIKTDSGQTGSRAIRAALILASADRDGLTLLNVLRKFPTSSVRIDLARALEIANELSTIFDQTEKALALVSQQSTAAVADSPVNLSQLPDLQQRGSFTWRKETLKLNDTNRHRQFLADIYLPISSGIQQPQTPAKLIVISHGLGSDRQTFVYLAEHLASYGFAVAVPEHPGSNAQQLQDLLSGKANEVSEPIEFINRPLDIKFLLNELTLLSQFNPAFKGKINLREVGMIGQSFGGYTALVLAGATLNFPKLQKDCAAINNSWNTSLLLQCRALLLPPSQYNNLRDERIKAAIAINPISSSILGPDGLSQIKIPVMFVSGSADTVAPALAEQIQPFTWLTTPNKYLVVMKNGTHFSTLAPTESDLPLPESVLGPDLALARSYTKAFGLAFFGFYIANRPQYQPYLSASYVESIGREPLTLSFVRSLSQIDLKAALQRSTTQATTSPKGTN
ncbi:alpha/beta hydrolase [Argonema galeatum]|uniref:alpha/beta hydrolase n=1 Tax=Argonema galeatum TaxID=2942762 RepID=UPI002012FA76|nr:alpha/beta hydrolase [Argonema galeatum]MCL1464073.1 alpha/beta hydrolase [Argonema galeatum A003/A1]